MQKVCVIAINRAKRDAAEACRRLATDFGVEIKAYMLVSSAFKNSPAYRGDETEGYFEEINIDFDDNNLISETIDAVSAGTDVTISHCIIESAMNDYAKVIPFLKNALTQTPESLIISSEKSKMRSAIYSKYPEICPKFIVVSSHENFSQSMIEDFMFPVIVKPNGLTSSFLVTKCKNYESLQICLKKTFDVIHKIYDREHGVGDQSVLIEEFIVGDMYSIDAYVSDDATKITYLPPVRVITSDEVGLPGFYGYERVVPTDLAPEDICDANECARKTIEALGLKFSTAHVELYKTSNGWKIIELGPRIGGYRQELYKEAFGIEHFYNDILIHYGKDPIMDIKWNKHAAAINIYADSEGTISSISGLEEAKKISSVVMLNQHSKPGDTSVFAVNGGKYVVDCILANTNKEMLEYDITQIRKLVKIEIK